MSRPIVVSLRSRGVATVNVGKILDPVERARNVGPEFFDIGLSILIVITLQSFTTWLSLLVMILSFVYFAKGTRAQEISDLAWLPACFLVCLPLLWIVHQNYSRREQAVVAVAAFKSSIFGIHTLYQAYAPKDAASAPDDMGLVLQTLLEDVQTYFQRPRPYARHFSLLLLSGSTASQPPVYHISREMGLCMRRINRHIKTIASLCQGLATVGVEVAVVEGLVQNLVALQNALDRMAAAKELRTPLALRTMLRSTCVVLIPLLVAPSFNYLRQEGGFAWFGLFQASMIQMFVMVLLTLSMDMEDPFDDMYMDNISMLEVKEGIGYLLMDDEEEEGEEEEEGQMSLQVTQLGNSVPGASQDPPAAPRKFTVTSEGGHQVTLHNVPTA